MSIYSYYGSDDPDVQLSPEEQQLMRDSQAGGSYAAGGTAIGSIGGAIVGGLLGSLIPGGTLIGAGIGSSLGGGLGGWVGGSMGRNVEQSAQDRLAAIQEKKFGPEQERQARIQAMNQLIGQWTPYL